MNTEIGKIIDAFRVTFLSVCCFR